MLRRVFKRGISVLIILAMMATLVPISDVMIARAMTSCKSGIKGNGTGGIYIDINSAPYNKINYNNVAYNTHGCTWFAAGRVTQLLNLKNPAGINAGPYWWRTTNNLNLKKGQEMKAPSVLCWGPNSYGASHVAVLEKIDPDGKYAYISEGGMQAYSDVDHGYAVIRKVKIADVTKCGDREFLGYVYLNGATAVTPAKPGSFSLSVKSQYNASENISISWTASSNAQNYGLVVKDSSGKDVFNQKVTGTSRSIGMLAAGTYTVTMTPYNSAGSGTAVKKTFTVVKPKPGAFNLTIKSQYTTSEDVVISWTKPSNATVYLLSVRKLDNNGNEIGTVFNSNQIKITSHNIGKLSAGSYRVQVTPYNTAGAGSTVGGETVKAFITVKDTSTPTPTPVPTPVPTPTPTPVPIPTPEPEPMEVGICTLFTEYQYSDTEDIVFTWTQAQNADGYILVVTDSSGYQVFNQELYGERGNIGLLPMGNYIVSLTPYNSLGYGSTIESSFSVEGTAIDDLPEVISVTYKEYEEYYTDDNLTFSWETSGYADSYRVVLESAYGETVEKYTDYEYVNFGQQSSGMYYLTVIPISPQGEIGVEKEISFMIYERDDDNNNNYYDDDEDNDDYYDDDEDDWYFEFEKEENPLRLKVKYKTYKRKKELKKARSFNIGVTNGEGDIDYILSPAAKMAKIKVSYNGKVRIPKNCKRGNYIIYVKAYGNDEYEAATKTVKIKVK